MSLFDDNAAILADIQASGTLLDSPRKVDFEHIFASAPAAEAFAADAREEGFETSIHESDLTDLPWNVTVSQVMVPDCGALTVTEDHLDTMARARGGCSDGWGFFTS